MNHVQQAKSPPRELKKEPHHSKNRKAVKQEDVPAEIWRVILPHPPKHASRRYHVGEVTPPGDTGSSTRSQQDQADYPQTAAAADEELLQRQLQQLLQQEKEFRQEELNPFDPDEMGQYVARVARPWLCLGSFPRLAFAKVGQPLGRLPCNPRSFQPQQLSQQGAPSLVSWHF